MRARSRSSKETITLSWEMPYGAWDHWAQGRGKKSVRDVILEGIGQIRENPEAVRERCKSWPTKAQPEDDDGSVLKYTVEIELPAAEWGEAIRRVGRIDNRPGGTRELLAALILESDSWKQCGDPDGELDSGWNAQSLISSLDSLTATTAGVSKVRKITAPSGSWAGSATTPHVVYNLIGPNARVNFQSSDSSTNVVSVESPALFADLRKAIQNHSLNSRVERRLIQNVAAMESAVGTKKFAERYGEFVAATADHMTLVAPFLPALTQLLL